MSETDMPLSGIRVLDTTNIIAGPLCGMVLADFGADVVKLEPPDGDEMRRQTPLSEKGVGMWWKMLSRNKRSVVCDFNDPDHRAALHELVATADVILLGFRPSTLARWDMSPERLRGLNERLIIGSITGFGDKGPLADAPGFGTLAEALSGFAHRNGFPDGPPILPPLGLADNFAGLSLALGVTLALAARAKTGRGQSLSVSLVEPLLTLLSPQEIDFHATGHVMPRAGNRSPKSVIRNLYTCNDDRVVALSCSSTGTARRMLQLIGRGDITTAPWFNSPAERVQRADEIDAIVAAWFAGRSSGAAMKILRDAELPAAPVNDASMAATDEQLRANESFVTINDAEVGDVTMPNVFIRMDETPGRIRWTGPQFGDLADSVVNWAASERPWDEIRTGPRVHAHAEDAGHA